MECVYSNSRDLFCNTERSLQRRELQSILRFIQDTSDTVKDKMGIAKAHSGDVLRYIQEDAGVVPKAIIITVAGLGGIVAGYRGKQGSHSTWKTWKNESTPGKPGNIMEF